MFCKTIEFIFKFHDTRSVEVISALSFGLFTLFYLFDMIVPGLIYINPTISPLCVLFAGCISSIHLYMLYSHNLTRIIRCFLCYFSGLMMFWLGMTSIYRNDMITLSQIITIVLGIGVLYSSMVHSIFISKKTLRDFFIKEK